MSSANAPVRMDRSLSLPGSSSGSQALRNSPPFAKRAKLQDFASILRHSQDGETRTMSSLHSPRKSLIICDSIHDHIHIPPACKLLIDTPQFQRLRYLKQTGACHFVFPNATHTRFQHSLGVGHLARQFATALRDQNKDTGITDIDILCVMMAGLCHDLGHGPFSHLWESFIDEANPAADWHHEHSSIRMLDYLIESNDLMSKLRDHGLEDRDIIFIKEQIAGPLGEDGMPVKEASNVEDEQWPYKGRSEEKAFLYEIVANKISGVDVDKWDYFLRDDYYLKVGHIFNYERFILFSKIVETDDGRKRLCIRDKEAKNILDMFQDRARLHQNAYQHRVVKVIDRMLVDAWLLADRHIFVRGYKGQKLRLSESCEDIVAHSKLTDEFVHHKIHDAEENVHPDLVKAREILDRIQRRDFYRCVARARLDMNGEIKDMSALELTKELRSFIPNVSEGMIQNGDSYSLLAEELVVLKKNVNMGAGNKNPMKKVKFYNKYQRTIFDHTSDEILLDNMPRLLNEITLLFVCKRNDASALRQAIAAVEMWGLRHQVEIEIILHVDEENGSVQSQDSP